MRLGWMTYLLTVCLLWSCIGEEPEPSWSVQPGERLPQFSVVDNNGIRWDNGSLAGKVSLLTLFNTSCQDCRHELPVIQRLYESYAGSGTVNFICISREQSAASVQEYWNEQGFTLPYSAQDDRTIYEMFTNEGIPFIVISDVGGTIRYTYNYHAMPGYEQLQADIEALLD